MEEQQQKKRNTSVGTWKKTVVPVSIKRFVSLFTGHHETAADLAWVLSITYSWAYSLSPKLWQYFPVWRREDGLVAK